MLGKTYLYANGNQCTGITGGWTSFTMPGKYLNSSVTNSSTTQYAAVFNENNIYLNAPAINGAGTVSTVRTTNMIDFSSYNTLYVSCNIVGNYGHGYKMVLQNNLSFPYTWVTSGTYSAELQISSSTNSDIVLQLDISSVTGSQYVFIQASGWQWGTSQGPYYTTVKIYEVWVE